MQLDLAGKTALVTGSSRGIGRAIAEALHAEGCRLAVNGRTPDSLDAVATALPGSVALTADVTQPEQASRLVTDVVAALGNLDILVCNVGSGSSVPPGEENPQAWQQAFSTNLWSATNVIEAARESLAASHGAIVCISSICAQEVVPGAPITYSAAKAALNAYVRGMARPLGKQGVRINAVAPGNILFDGSVWLRKQQDDPAGVKAMLEREVALSRLGTPHEIAGLVAYLASPAAGFASGAVWTMDGGQIRA